jgi:CheY-like chemotaxis protein
MPRVVLIVDDDSSIVDGLREFLQVEGYDVLCAGDGTEALTVLERDRRPDVIVLDLLMPGMDGWDFRAAQLRDSSLAQIPVVILSASGFNPQTIIKQLRVQEYISKPLNPHVLAQALKRVSSPTSRPH